LAKVSSTPLSIANTHCALILQQKKFGTNPETPHSSDTTNLPIEKMMLPVGSSYRKKLPEKINTL
jgi:hypothetical protein